MTELNETGLGADSTVNKQYLKELCPLVVDVRHSLSLYYDGTLRQEI